MILESRDQSSPPFRQAATVSAAAVSLYGAPHYWICSLYLRDPVTNTDKTIDGMLVPHGPITPDLSRPIKKYVDGTM